MDIVKYFDFPFRVLLQPDRLGRPISHIHAPTGTDVYRADAVPVPEPLSLLLGLPPRAHLPHTVPAPGQPLKYDLFAQKVDLEDAHFAGLG